MSRTVKRLLSLFLAVSMFCGTFAVTAAAASPQAAAENTCEVKLIDLPRSGDPNKSGWGHPDLKYMNGWNAPASKKMVARGYNSYSGKTCYCIEPGVGGHSGDILTQKGSEYWEDFPDNGTIKRNDIQALIGRILQYGWTGNNNVNWNTTNPVHADELGNMKATQILIHETIVGERRADFSKVDAHAYGCNNALEQITPACPIYNTTMKHYVRIADAVRDHVKVPDFGGSEFEMNYDGSKYTVTLTDKNTVLSKCNLTSNADVQLSVSGNNLTISTTTPPAGDITVTAEKQGMKRKAFLVWTDYIVKPGTNNIQDQISYGEEISDPLQKVNVRLKIASGNAKIVKESEDGYKAGFNFQITGNNFDKTVTTDSSGSFTVTGIPAGTYTVTEKLSADQSRYVQPKSQTVTINPGQTATVTFSNKLKRGSAQFQKTDLETGKEIESKDGIFGVYSWNKNAQQYERIGQMKYDNEKKAYVISNLPVTDKNDGIHKIVEEKAPTGYVKPTNIDYEFTISQDGQVHHINNGKITNNTQKAKIEISKTDKETGKGLGGAVYDIIAYQDIVVNGDVKFKKGSIVDTVTTKENSPVSTKPLYLGEYTVKEKTAALGYVIDNTEYRVSLTYQGQTVEVFTEHLDVADKPQKGRIQVIKQGEVLDNFDFMQTEFGLKYSPIYEVQNLSGAVYEITALEDIIVNGDIKHHKGDLIETLTTTTEGAVSKPLYLGKYLVREITAPESYFIGANEYEVELKYHDQTVDVFTDTITSYNERQHIKIRLEKQIEENVYYPNPEAYKDIVFGIFSDEDILDDNGDILLEKDSLVDCFGINEIGQGVSSTDLPCGTKWYVKELQTSEGYVLNKNIYPFEFTPQAQEIPLIWIDLNKDGTVIQNNVMKGAVELIKKSDFDDELLADAVYGIFRESDDKQVDELVTDSNGYARSNVELHYGEYYIKELTPPPHYYIDENVYHFFVGSAGEEFQTIHYDFTDTPRIGALVPDYNEKGWKDGLAGIIIPRTGDGTQVILGVAILCAAISLPLAITVIYKKRHKKANDEK